MSPDDKDVQPGWEADASHTFRHRNSGEVRADSFTLRNASGVEVGFLAYGGTIASIRVPDREGVLADITPGFDTLEEYKQDGRFFGALVGRYANRIANGRFLLDGVEYNLPINDRKNHLHGGPGGLHTRTWDVTPFTTPGISGASLSYTSEAGDQGYPGQLDLRVTYALDDDNAFTIDFSATTDAPTPVNLTQHAYFNLGGHDSGDILDHQLFVNASAYTPVDDLQIPTGELRTVRGTAFDFTEQRTIGAAMRDVDEQLRIGGGYDHNFVLDARFADRPSLAARVYEPVSGRTLEIFTTEPGMQFYSGNGIDGGPPGKGGCYYPRYGAFALETQHFPDSPNQPAFPSTILRPDEEFRSRTIWRFSAQ